MDFVQPGYLGDEKHFHEMYDPGGGDSEEAVANRRIARKRLSSRLRPILLRRVKKQVAKDLPDRIEQRHDCELARTSASSTRRVTSQPREGHGNHPDQGRG